MKPVHLLFSIACVLGPAVAFAGTCDAPTAIADASKAALKGSTCSGQSTVDMGGTIYAHPSQVYSFTYDGNGGALTIAGKDREMSLTTSCTTAPVAAGAPNVPIDLAKLTKGTKYLLVVSTDPSVPLAKSPVCGDYSVSGAGAAAK